MPMAVREAQLSFQNHTRDKMLPRVIVGPKTFPFDYFSMKSSCKNNYEYLRNNKHNKCFGPQRDYFEANYENFCASSSLGFF